MNIRETNKGNVKLVMSKEEFKALHALVDFPTLTNWDTIAVENHIDKNVVADVWDGVHEYHKARLL